jgi:hypothetical protein
MSGNDRPEVRAYRELEMLVRHLGEELATFRRRAIAAEAQLKEPGRGGHGGGGGGAERAHGKSGAAGGHLSEAGDESAALTARLKRAEDRVRQMMDRVRFLRQQLQLDTTAKAARS